MRFRITVALAVLAILSSFALTVHAVQGTVTNSSGDPVDGALVTFTVEFDPDIYFSGNTDETGRYNITVPPVSVDEELPVPFALQQNYPNPFNPSTTIPFSLDRAGQVRLTVYNVMGQKVASLLDDYFSPGLHTVKWDGRDDSGNNVSAGLYIYKLTFSNRHETRKMLLLDGGPGTVSGSHSTLNSGRQIVSKKAAGTSYIVTITHDSTIPYEETAVIAADDQTLDFVVIGTSLIEGIKFVSIPGGTFRMGDIQGGGRDSESPVHDVTLTGFEMSIYEVTNAQYVKYLTQALASGDITASNNYVLGETDDVGKVEFLDLFSGDCDIVYSDGTFSVRENRENNPVIMVNWFGARGFADYYGLDLPTEAEWEYACRAGTETKYYTGNDESSLARADWYSADVVGWTSAVGQKEPNAWGLYDMHGNVQEWCRDWYDPDYYSSSPQSNPTGAKKGERVQRGGDWKSSAEYCRSASRASFTPIYGFNNLGFRVVRRSPEWVLDDGVVDNGSGGDPVEIKEMTFVTIPGGTFQMGDEDLDYDLANRPIHTVTVSTFEMSIYEVTYAQYASYLNEALASGDIVAGDSEVTGNTGDWSGQLYINLSGYIYNKPDNNCKIVYENGSFSVTSGYENWPVSYVSWYGAKAFAEHSSLDLPTEAEWEYACRGGKQYKYGTSDGTISSDNANYYDRRVDLHPFDVGSYPANPFGLYDMSGNVWEWCNDWFGPYSGRSAENPTGPQTGLSRMQRGGSWFLYADTCLSSRRWQGRPDDSYGYVGFRVVRRSPDWIPDVEVDDGVTGMSGPHDFDGMDFATIPGGTFRMGDIQDYNQNYNEKPVHEVTLSGFEMSIYEVTVAQYVKFLNEALETGDIEVSERLVTGKTGDWYGQVYVSIANNIQYADGIFTEKTDRGNYPVDYVTWYGAKAFTEYYGLELPTEAEWEYACRAGTETMFYAGNDLSSDGKTSTDLDRAGWYQDNNSYPWTHSVGFKEPNAWGLYDMHGNVMEWCSDLYDSNYYSTSPSSNPTGAETGIHRAIRGGGWNIKADRCRSAYRSSGIPYDSDGNLGFRVVRR